MKLHALVVDDSAITRKMVMRSLKDTNVASFHFTEACDGQDALAKFDPEKTELIFVDWYMPNLDGLAFCMEVRKRMRRDVPIVMITVENTLRKVEEAVELGGVDAFLCKPFTTLALKRKIMPLIEGLAIDARARGGFFGALSRRFV